MYVCEKCGYKSKPGEVAHKLVTKVREKVYRHEPEEEEPFETRGYEIVQEITACKDCVAVPGADFSEFLSAPERDLVQEAREA